MPAWVYSKTTPTICVIAGIWTHEGMPAGRLCEAVRGMAYTLAHRGPGDPDRWVDLVRILLMLAAWDCFVARAERVLT